jgi:hypothetical protein
MKKLVCLFALAACGSPAASDDDAVTPDAGTPREQVGAVTVTEDTRWQTAHVLGQLYDGDGPSFHHVEATDGACTLLRYSPSNCDPACTDGLCTAPDVCTPWPTLLSAGRLTIDGLATSVTIDPVGNYYYEQNPLPSNLFDDDAHVTAHLAGADLPAMDFATTGVPPLHPDYPDDKIMLTPGADYTLAWTPAGSGRVRVELNANNQGHGMPYLAIIRCDVPDAAGEVVVPHALIDAFPETQAWEVCAGTDCPPSLLTRYHAASFALDDDREIDFIVQSQYAFGVDHVLPD